MDTQVDVQFKQLVQQYSTAAKSQTPSVHVIQFLGHAQGHASIKD